MGVILKTDPAQIVADAGETIDGEVCTKILGAYDRAAHAAPLTKPVERAVAVAERVKAELVKLETLASAAGVFSDDVADADGAMFRLIVTLKQQSMQATQSRRPGERVDVCIARAVERGQRLGKNHIFVAAVLFLSKREKGEWGQVQDRIGHVKHRATKKAATVQDAKKKGRRKAS